MLGLGPYLLMLSQAVEWTLRGGSAPAGLSEEDLLLLATQDDPGLLERFRDYRLRVLRTGGHAAVLVCTRDGRQGLLEDAACSDGLDRHLWRERPPRPCAFTLDPERACNPE